LNKLFPSPSLFSLPAIRKYINISSSDSSTAEESSLPAPCLTRKMKALPSSAMSGNYTSTNIASHIGRLELYGSNPPPSGFGKTLGFHKTSSAFPPQDGE